MSTNSKPFAFQRNIKILIWVFGLLLAWPFLRSLSTNNDLNIFFGAAERLTQLKNPIMHLSKLFSFTEPLLYKAELIHRRAPWKTKESVELATLQWVHWFNHIRLLEPIGYIPPAEAEENYYRKLAHSQETIVST